MDSDGDGIDDDVEVGLVSFAGSVNVEVNPTLDRSIVDRRIDRLDLAESTAIGDALSVATRLLVDSADDDGLDEPTSDDDVAPGVIVLLTDGETTVGRDTSAGAEEAAAAGIPVFTIAFGTPDGTIVDPLSGQIVDVPVRPADRTRPDRSHTGGSGIGQSTPSNRSSPEVECEVWSLVSPTGMSLSLASISGIRPSTRYSSQYSHERLALHIG